MSSRGRVLVLWNQLEEDIYEQYRADGPKGLAWDPSRVAPDVGTVAEEMNALKDALVTGRFDVEMLNVKDDLQTLLRAVNDYRPDAVFNFVEYFHDNPDHEPYIAGLFELLGVSYTGNRPTTLATCQNKYRTKLLLEAAGLPTAQFFLAGSISFSTDHGLEFPLIVKPAFEDASGGIDTNSVVHDHESLVAQVAHVLREFSMPALVEEYIEGREIHAAILGNHNPQVLPLFEMVFDDSEFNPHNEWRPQIISYRAKWDPFSKDFYSMEARVPPQRLDSLIEEYIRKISVEAFTQLRCRDYARVDMRIAEDGQPFILEINPNPDLTFGAAFSMCSAAAGLSYPETLGSIADFAIARGRKPKVHKDSPSDQLLREYVERRALRKRTEPT